MIIEHIPVKDIHVDSSQVRKTFRKDSLSGLARSINEIGLLHPLLVKKTAEKVVVEYKLIAGERRLRAAKELGLAKVPCVILKPGVPVVQVQLVENLQREDLNPVERAMAVREFMDMDNLTKSAAAKRLGIPRTTLTDWLDVLEVEERYQRALIDNFNGGDSPLTLSHITEGRALAARLRSPALCNILLDAILEFRLSKVETREVCTLVRENADVSIDAAVRLIRRPVDVNKLPKDEEDERLAVERNIEYWVTTLERSTDTMTQLGRIAPYYLSEGERERITNRLEEMNALLSQTLHHINTNTQMPPPPPKIKVRSRKKKKNKAS